MADENNTPDYGDEVSPLQAVAAAAVAAAVTPPPAKPEGEGTTPPPPASDHLSEGEETPEEKEAREKEEAAAERLKRQRVPVSRLNEVTAKARAREQQLLEEITKLKGGQEVVAAQKVVDEKRTKINELQDQYEELILDGKKDEARAVRQKVDALREELMDIQTSRKSEYARQAAIDDMTFTQRLEVIETQHPELDPDHDKYDQELTSEVGELMNTFIKAGTNRAVALTKAVKYVMGATATTPAPTPPPAKPSAAQAQAEAARRKAAAAVAAQPANIAGIGAGGSKGGAAENGGVDVMRLTQAEFAKLDEATRARLRGDEL